MSVLVSLELGAVSMRFCEATVMVASLANDSDRVFVYCFRRRLENATDRGSVMNLFGLGVKYMP